LIDSSSIPPISYKRSIERTAVEKTVFSESVYKLNFIVFTHGGGIVFPEKSKEELVQFISRDRSRPLGYL